MIFLTSSFCFTSEINLFIRNASCLENPICVMNRSRLSGVGEKAKYSRRAEYHLSI